MRPSDLFPPLFNVLLPVTVTFSTIGPMSSTNHASSSTPNSIFEVILNNALNDYTKKTGIDFAKYDFVKQLETCNSPDEVLWLFRDKAKQFKEYREGNRRLINWITPIVQGVHVLSGCLGE